MDFRNPISSLVPGATGRILEVLTRNTVELKLTALASIAGVSPAQASRVLPRLVELGLVTRFDVPPASLFAINRDHLSAAALEMLDQAPSRVVGKLRDLVAAIRPAPVSVTLFGSVARGMATSDSDIDILLERAVSVPEDDLEWIDTTTDWVLDVRASTGNRVNVIEVTDAELPGLLRKGSSFWRSIADEGVHISGRPIDEVLRRRDKKSAVPAG
jgi:nucleotidyltransferase-like protein/IclR-like helix-turn-helix domain-containing protein